MVWRIHFTAEDLARVQVSATLGPLSETVLAMSLIRGAPMQPRHLFGAWRSQVGSKVTPQMRALTDLIPAGSRGVDLCTLAGEAPTLEQGLAALLAVPREQMLLEMGLFDRWHRLPASAWALVEPGAREPLADAMLAAHRVLIEPYWTRMLACLEAEQVVRRRTLASSGPDRLLASLQSERIRWRPPVLEVLVCNDVDLQLEGRGLSLVPSVFTGKMPNLIHDPCNPSAMPRLILPASDERVRDRRPVGRAAIERGGAGRAGRQEPGRGARSGRRRLHDHRAGRQGRHLDRGGQPARVGAARRGPDHQQPPGRRGAARAHPARHRSAAGRVAPGAGPGGGRTSTASGRPAG